MVLLVLFCSIAGTLPGAIAGAQENVPEVVREQIDRAASALRAGRHDQAIHGYEEAIRLGPEVAEAHLGLGAAHLANGSAEASLAAFRAGLDRLPDHPQLLYNAAVVALRLGEAEQAEPWVARALSQNPRDVQLLVLRATLLDRSDRSREALASLLEAAREEPRNASLQFRLGNQYHRLGEGQEAVDAYRRALKLDSGLQRAQYNLAAVLVELGRPAEAAEAYEKALRDIARDLERGKAVDADHARAFANLGASYIQLEQWKAARTAYDRAVRIDGSLADAHYNLGFAQFRLGQKDAAADAHERALALDAALPLAYLQLGQIHHEQGNCGRAVERLEAGLPHYGAEQRIEAFESLAGCYNELGQPKKAEEALRTVIAATPADPDLLFELGVLLVESGRLEEARSALEKSLGLRPESLETATALLPLLDGDPPARRQLLTSMAVAHGERPELWYLHRDLALIELEGGAVDAARQPLESLAAAERAPEKWQRWAGRALATLELVSGENGDLEALRRTTGSAGSPAGARALVLAADGDADAAIRLLRGESSAASGADATAAGAAAAAERERNLGLLLWSRGQWTEAETRLRSLIGGGASADPAIQTALGHSLLALGRPAEALPRLESASTLCRQAGAPRVVGLTVRTPVTADAMCAIAERSVEIARLQVALDHLGRGLSSSVETLTTAALEGELTDGERAMALLVRGTGRLGRGRDARAVDDLRAALRTGPDSASRAVASNNLGVALTRLGRHGEAEKIFAEARQADPGLAEATLNLAILLDDHLGRPGEALPLYESYRNSGGARGAEVAGWVARLREIYP